MKKSILFICFCLFIQTSCFSQSIEGVWETIDDKTGEAKSHVEIYKVNQKYFGKVIKLLKIPTDTKCQKCEGDKKNQPILGMVIISDLSSYKDYWSNGTILDPKTGSTYACSIWFEGRSNKKLILRGKHWTGLFRDQTWNRIR